jgi:hypothetical protein
MISSFTAIMATDLFCEKLKMFLFLLSNDVIPVYAIV